MNHKTKILRALREADGALVPTTKLNAICWRYGARIYDLRRDGHNIEGEHIEGPIWGFRLNLPGQQRLAL